jgi:signal peptidase
MENAIDGGDIAVVRAIDPAILRKGDIISFSDGKSVTTHRIVELTEKDGLPAFITQGDANDTQDANPISYEQIQGKYLFRIPKIGHLAMLMQTPVGMIAFIVVPVCALVLIEMILSKRRAKRELDSLKSQFANETE